MRASAAMKLVSAGCTAILASMPAPAAAEKHIFDLRTGNDFGSDANCGEIELLCSSEPHHWPK
ncbi:unnamed protein product [Ectocarpus sp. CCAP 1310/34]|nr:unnamed protein product [Ectocarpus sp. CCAP 1310/34]